MIYVREHEAASVHRLTVAGQKKADRTIARMRKQMRAKAAKLRERAEALISEASELEYLANRYGEYETPFAKVRDEIEAENAPKFMPAYCDPENERRGAKHDATRHLSRAEIAKRMRADIKALALPKGFKVSVRTSEYSGGGSIDIRVTAAPAGFRYYSEAAASWHKQFPGREHRMPMAWRDAQSDELRALLDKLGAIHGSYNRDNSDSMTDYFDVRYYGGAEIDWQLARDLQRADVAASPGTYWHESAGD